MSLVQPSVPERRPSPALSLNLSSNNPFRNRAASPQGLPSPSPSLPTPRTTAQRPQSRNPFLAEFEGSQPPQSQFQSQFPAYQPNNMATDKPSYATAAEELFAEMSLQDKDEKKAGPDGTSFPRPPGPPRSGTAPGRPPRRPMDEDHRRNASGSRAPPRRPPREELDIFKSPERGGETRRPRRNSESSIMDKHSMEEERRRRERRHRERKERESGRKDGKVRKPRGLDLIDKLDVSGIYGPSMFHHDGPFDACNPHRNRKGSQRAPMQAFPEGSANNVMGGSGPVNASMNLDQFHGRGAEGFSDFSSAARNDDLPKPSAGQAGFYNPKSDIEPIHGDESNGLGSSTFLEGAPASRKDMERRDSEQEMGMGGGGLARKKSLAQRIRGISQPRRDYGGRVVSPGVDYESRRPPPPPPVNGQSSPLGGPQSAGGRGKLQEKNPFFDDYDEKGASVGRARAPSSPGRPNLERLPTGEAGPADEPKPSGFLTRMKSLKGGPRKPKPERRPS
ncbi:putative membrane associated protein pal1 protein [Lasiodiplodia theobromae]|uniref:Protein PAL1 n=1 Tax=Lasiodiplodia theobromae TaxID=45133 RepID=A0A5N5CY42_9PEZI|nr:Membrane associated protein Pal1 [Lasiodiplodia theobromae]KAB2570273.1 Protein PAL1 [Lasiodiplodia theobromae]KAF4539810.1 Membrane associated protein Pal1 [Lasiodiplodia theobromae]KAF9636718.1 putative membrane associated protein pal1 protein [Lasiodiplodia theobromae]